MPPHSAADACRDSSSAEGWRPWLTPPYEQSPVGAVMVLREKGFIAFSGNFCRGVVRLRFVRPACARHIAVWRCLAEEEAAATGHFVFILMFVFSSVFSFPFPQKGNQTKETFFCFLPPGRQSGGRAGRRLRYAVVRLLFAASCGTEPRRTVVVAPAPVLRLEIRGCWAPLRPCSQRISIRGQPANVPSTFQREALLLFLG